VHRAIVDAEAHDQPDLGNEQDAEEEGQAAYRLVAPPLESLIVNLVGRHAEQVEGRQQDHGRQDRVDAEHRVADIGDVGAKQDDGRVGDVHDVEHAECDRHADRYRRIEAAEQQPGNDGVDQQIGRGIHDIVFLPHAAIIFAVACTLAGGNAIA